MGGVVSRPTKLESLQRMLGLNETRVPPKRSTTVLKRNTTVLKCLCSGWQRGTYDTRQRSHNEYDGGRDHGRDIETRKHVWRRRRTFGKKERGVLCREEWVISGHVYDFRRLEQSFEPVVYLLEEDTGDQYLFWVFNVPLKSIARYNGPKPRLPCLFSLLRFLLLTFWLGLHLSY